MYLMLLDVRPPTTLAADMERYQFLSRAIELLRQYTGNEGSKLPSGRNERQFGAWKNYRANALRPTNRRLHHQRNVIKALLIEADPSFRVSDESDDIDPLLTIELAAGQDAGFDSDIDLSPLPQFQLTEEEWVDPLEDYTGYAVVDAGGDITVGANLITVSSMSRDVDSWVVSDKDAGHFDGDFAHLLRTQSQTGSSAGGRAGVWAIANAVDEIVALLGGDALVVRWQTSRRLRAIESNGGTTQNSTTSNLDKDQNYYLTVDRDESEGTYGLLSVEIDDDSDRASPVTTISLDLTEKQDFRYIYGVASSNSGDTHEWTGLVADLDLQEAVAVVASPYYYQHILGSGSS